MCVLRASRRTASWPGTDDGVEVRGPGGVRTRAGSGTAIDSSLASIQTTTILARSLFLSLSRFIVSRAVPCPMTVAYNPPTLRRCHSSSPGSPPLRSPPSSPRPSRRPRRRLPQATRRSSLSSTRMDTSRERSLFLFTIRTSNRRSSSSWAC